MDIKENKYKMTKLELKEWITALACSLDRGDIKLDELVNEVEEVIDKNITEQLILSGVVKSGVVDCSTCKHQSVSKYVEPCYGCRDNDGYDNYEKY